MGNKKYRVVHYPTIQGNPFIVEVSNLAEAFLIYHTLGEYDSFEVQSKIKSKDATATMIEEYNMKENVWRSWHDTEININDIRDCLDKINFKPNITQY